MAFLGKNNRSILDKTLTFRLIFLLLFLLAAFAFSMWMWWEEYYIFFAFGVLGGLFAFIGIIRFSQVNNRKLAFMFNSIENSDYAFKFIESDRMKKDERLVNEALNRIKGLLTKARDETIDQEKYYQIILESVTTGVVVVNSSGHVTQTNHEAVRLLGIEPFTHVNQAAKLDPEFPALLREIQPGENRQMVWHNERGTMTLSVNASELRRRGENLKVLALSDIENELSDREIESWIRLIRVLTHEIMNSVNPITSISDSLVERVREDDDNQLKQGLETISETAKGLISFVESYRKFTRLPQPKPTLFYLNEFMEHMCSLALARIPEAERKNYPIELSVEPSDLILYADKGLVSQVVTNLLKNAMEAVSEVENPQIKFSAIIDSREQVIISVENNGPNIPAEVVDHIFVPFFTTKLGGSGVGLSLSRQIMRLHGGTLKYRPAAGEQGSIFTMMFR